MASEDESKTPPGDDEAKEEEEVADNEQATSTTEEPSGEEKAESSSEDKKKKSDEATKKEAEPKKKVQVKEEPSIYDEQKKAGKDYKNESGRIDSKQQQSNNGSGAVEFPAPFYCPITEKIFVDPVVFPNGVSYERSAAKGREGAEKAYSNRALKAVIDETVEMSGSSVRAGIKRMQHTMKKQLSQVLEKSIIPSDEYHPLPDVYYCPITFSIIHDPVIDAEGNTFERVAVENWIRANGNSPLTRTPASVESLYPNLAIEDLLNIEKGRTEGSIHPSIRKWKEEEPPKATDPELGGSAAPAPPQRFPVSVEELEREEARRRRQAQLSLVALFFTAVLILLALAYGGIFSILCLFAICFGPSCTRDAAAAQR